MRLLKTLAGKLDKMLLVKEIRSTCVRPENSLSSMREITLLSK